MRIFIDIGHPAHVHYFRNFIKIMEKEGHTFIVSARDRYPVFSLLEFYNINYYNRGKGKNSKIGKLLYMLKADFLLLRKAIKFKPDLFISFGGAYTTHVAYLLKKPSFVFDDTDNAYLSRKLYLPFVTNVFTPNIYKHDLGDKQIRFNGYMELAYLHPRYYKANKKGHEILGIENNEKYIIIRFVNWLANHDYGHNGISDVLKIRIVEKLSRYARVFISSEKELKGKLEKFRINILPHQMHDVLATSSLLFGESSTMASECAVLGVPAIYIDNEGRSYTDEEEKKYGIVFNFKETEKDILKALEKSIEILESGYLFKEKCDIIISEKISFTDYLIWLVKEYPDSISTLKRDRDYENRFIFN